MIFLKITPSRPSSEDGGNPETGGEPENGGETYGWRRKAGNGWEQRLEYVNFKYHEIFFYRDYYGLFIYIIDLRICD